MELRHIRYFVALADALHFGRAAERLNVSQPALSQQISALEKEIGAPLLLRHSKGISLTPAGAMFLNMLARHSPPQRRRSRKLG
jgi:DNA-binding transcriptional LysR family regulator